MSMVYLNGQFLPQEQATVSVMDRGFLFGDGIYEVIPVYFQQPFQLDAHLERLHQSLDNIRLSLPSEPDWDNTIRELVKQNPEGGEHQYVYIQITRGAPNKRNHVFPEAPHPTIFMTTTPLPDFSMAALQQGVTLVTHEDIRWNYCHIKTISLQPNVLLSQYAVDNQVTETLLLRGDEVSEGARSNMFLVKDGKVFTPPKNKKILGGITRDFVIRLMTEHNIPFEERPIQTSELATADELWISSSTKTVVPAITLDGKPVGTGKPGPLWEQVAGHFLSAIEKLGR